MRPALLTACHGVLYVACTLGVLQAGGSACAHSRRWHRGGRDRQQHGKLRHRLPRAHTSSAPTRGPAVSASGDARRPPQSRLLQARDVHIPLRHAGGAQNQARASALHHPSAVSHCESVASSIKSIASLIGPAPFTIPLQRFLWLCPTITPARDAPVFSQVCRRRNCTCIWTCTWTVPLLHPTSTYPSSWQPRCAFNTRTCPQGQRRTRGRPPSDFYYMSTSEG